VRDRRDPDKEQKDFLFDGTILSLPLARALMLAQKRARRAVWFRLIKLINDKRRRGEDEQTGSDKCVCTPAAIQSAIVGDATMSSEPKRFSRQVISVSHRHCRRRAHHRRCRRCSVVDDVGRYRLTRR